jgi:hypothetical protein
LGTAPNTYAYTKALAEALVAESMDTLPSVIFRPSISKLMVLHFDEIPIIKLNVITT